MTASRSWADALGLSIWLAVTCEEIHTGARACRAERVAGQEAGVHRPFEPDRVMPA
jgi:hypothetical protein